MNREWESAIKAKATSIKFSAEGIAKDGQKPANSFSGESIYSQNLRHTVADERDITKTR